MNMDEYKAMITIAIVLMASKRTWIIGFVMMIVLIIKERKEEK